MSSPSVTPPTSVLRGSRVVTASSRRRHPDVTLPGQEGCSRRPHPGPRSRHLHRQRGTVPIWDGTAFASPRHHRGYHLASSAEVSRSCERTSRAEAERGCADGPGPPPTHLCPAPACQRAPRLYRSAPRPTSPDADVSRSTLPLKSPRSCHGTTEPAMRAMTRGEAEGRAHRQRGHQRARLPQTGTSERWYLGRRGDGNVTPSMAPPSGHGHRHRRHHPGPAMTDLGHAAQGELSTGAVDTGDAPHDHCHHRPRRRRGPQGRGPRSKHEHQSSTRRQRPGSHHNPASPSPSTNPDPERPDVLQTGRSRRRPALDRHFVASG
jgi:hypothetical protein